MSIHKYLSYNSQRFEIYCYCMTYYTSEFIIHQNAVIHQNLSTNYFILHTFITLSKVFKTLLNRDKFSLISFHIDNM